MTTSPVGGPHAAVMSAAAAPVASSADMRMLVMMVQNQLVQGEVAKVDVTLGGERLKELREQVREALQQAREAEEESGFFGEIGDVLGGDIATLAQIVVVAAAAVVTGGAAAVVLAAIAIACTLASKYGDELGIPPKVAMGLGVAAAISMVAAGNVGGATGAVTASSSGGMAASAGAAAGSVAPGVAAGSAVSSGGMAATATAASKVTWLTQTAHDVGIVANVVAPAASGGGVGASVVSAQYHGAAIRHDATVKESQGAQTLEQLDIDTALALFERSVEQQMSVTSQVEQQLQSSQRAKEVIIQEVA